MVSKSSFLSKKVSQLPEVDELSWSKKQLLAKMDVCMGGRVAEELVFGKDSITTGLFNTYFMSVWNFRKSDVLVPNIN